MVDRRSEVIKDKSEIGSEIEIELSRALKVNVKEYFKEAKRIIKVLKERRKVNKEFLTQIETFITYANHQMENMNLSEKQRLKYLDLIEEEESLHEKMKEDLKRNDELIKSIKKSTDVLFH